MAQSDLLNFVRSTTLSDLQSMIAARGKLDKLLEKKSALLKDISAIDQEITTIEKSLARPTSTKAKAPSTGIPRARASSFTGDAEILLPRPLGRSGCVTTPAMFHRASSNPSRIHAAKEGVPMNTIRVSSAGPVLPGGGVSSTE